MSRDTLVKSILILLLAETLKEEAWKGRIGILTGLVCRCSVVDELWRMAVLLVDAKVFFRSSLETLQSKSFGYILK
jgi:hypothetical protein